MLRRVEMSLVRRGGDGLVHAVDDGWAVLVGVLLEGGGEAVQGKVVVGVRVR